MRNTFKTSISLLLILILTIGMSLPVLAQSSYIVTEIFGNDPNMGDMCKGYKIDNVNNIKMGELFTLNEDDYHFTITKKLIDGIEYFDWTSNVPITHIFVKGGPYGNLFTYDHPVMSGTNLYPPLNKAGQEPEISHITFYVCEEEDAPSIDIEKYVSVDGGETWHDADSPTGPTASYPGSVKFKVVVTNTGNVGLTDIVVTDSDFTFTGVVSSLAAGAEDTSDILTVPSILGQHSNTATVNAEYDEEAITPDSDMAHYITYETHRPSIDIEKWVSVDGGETWHDADSPTGPTASYPGSVKFKVVVTNTGNVGLTDIVVTDSDFTFTGVVSSLAAGAEDTSDILTVPSILGQHSNTATVNAEYDEEAITPDSDMAHYITYETHRPSIDIEKWVSVDGGETWHDADSPTGPTATYPGTVKFKVIVTNTGNVGLTDIVVTDSDFTFTGVVSSLAAGAEDTSDILTVPSILGQHSNTATVNAEYDEEAITPDSDMAHYITYETHRPSIDIEKWVSVDGGETWHDADSPTGPTASYPGSVKFKVVVTNTGNVGLTDIVVTDSDFTFTGVVSSLAAGAEDTSDILTVPSILGQHSNTATVNAEYDEEAITPDSDMAHYITYETHRPSIDIEKYVSVDGGETWHDADSPTGPTIRLPGTVRFKVIVTNTGNVDLTNIVVTDPDFEFTGIVTSLDAGDHDESNVIAVPAERYQHSNTATVNAKYNEKPITPDSDMAHYYGDYERRDDKDADISIKKYVSVDGGTTWDDAENAPGPRASFPGTVQFKVVVKNTGDYRLTDIEVNDTDFDFTGVASSLNVGDSDTSDIITVASIDGQHTNTADVEGFYGSQKVTDSDMAHYYTKDDDNENGRIRLHKFMDENENGTQDPGEFHMQNVTFELYNADKSEMLSSKQTDNEGNLTFSNLAFGTYYLKEMSEYDITTSGFDANGFMQVIVNSEETITIIVGNDIDRELESDNIVIEEPVPLALPQTGELPPTQFYILGALLMLAGMFLKRLE